MISGHRKSSHAYVNVKMNMAARAGRQSGSTTFQKILNSDAPEYGGSGQGNLGGVDAVPVPLHGRARSLTLTLPPLGVLFLKTE
jgi:1,4-alpha-glucan branching enzyme